MKLKTNMIFNLLSFGIIAEDSLCGIFCDDRIIWQYVNISLGIIFPILFLLGPISFIASSVGGLLVRTESTSRKNTLLEEIFANIEHTPARALFVSELLNKNRI